MGGYGLVLICPKCPPKDYFGMLKTPGSKSIACPNCGAKLDALRRRADSTKGGIYPPQGL